MFQVKQEFIKKEIEDTNSETRKSYDEFSNYYKHEFIKEEHIDVNIEIYDEFSKNYKQEYEGDLEVKEENLTDTNIQNEQIENQDINAETRHSEEYLNLSNENKADCKFETINFYAKANAEKCRKYRMRKKAEAQQQEVSAPVKKPKTKKPMTSTERSQACRLRKRLSDPDMRVVTSEPLTQPFIASTVSNTIVDQVDSPVLCNRLTTTIKRVPLTATERSRRHRAQRKNQQLNETSHIQVLSNQDIVMDQEVHGLHLNSPEQLLINDPISNQVGTGLSSFHCNEFECVKMCYVKQEDVNEEIDDTDPLQIYDEYSMYKQDCQGDLEVKEENLPDTDIHDETENQDLSEETRHSDEYLNSNNENKTDCKYETNNPMKTKKIKSSDQNKSKNTHYEQKKVKNLQNQQLQRSKVTGVTLLVNDNERNYKNNKKLKRKNYTSEAIHQAIKAVKDGATLRKASYSFGVPTATLLRKIKNPELIDKKSGPSTVLKKQEEERIVKWIMYRANTGSPVTKNELFNSVESYLIREKRETIFKNNRPGNKWYDNFTKRHPDLNIRTDQNLALVSAMVTEKNQNNWFREVEEYLEKNNLKDLHKSRVFNCDEINIQFTDVAGKENITTLFMYNAVGKRAPPMILYPYKEDLPKKIIYKCPKGWSMGISETGWMTAETLYEYITNVFYPWIIQEQTELPVLIYLNGHASHVTIPLISFCRERKIEIITLFAHLRHTVRPLDIALFHPLKEFWKKAQVLWRNENNKCLKREDFAQVLLNALNLFEDESNAVKNGFCAAGLVPFNPNVLDIKTKTKKCTVECQATSYEEQHLMFFEANLSSDLLEKFKSCESVQIWDGAIENKGLFEYWVMIKKKLVLRV